MKTADSMTPLVGPAQARLAVEMMRPAIEQALRDPAVSGLGVLHVVLLDPAAPPGSPYSQALLHEQSIGPRERWDVDYAAYARAKALLSWAHRMDGRRLAYLHPQLLREGEAGLWGSVWLDGLVVAASGAQPIWDEAFSLGIAAALRSLAWQGAHQPELRPRLPESSPAAGPM